MCAIAIKLALTNGAVVRSTDAILMRVTQLSYNAPVAILATPLHSVHVPLKESVNLLHAQDVNSMTAGRN